MTNTLLKMLREIVCAQVLCFRPEGLEKKSNQKERKEHPMPWERKFFNCSCDLTGSGKSDSRLCFGGTRLMVRRVWANT